MSDLAPVVYFAYNRPWHAKASLEALQANPLAAQTDVIIYLDGPRTPDAAKACLEVRRVVDRVEGFRSISVRPRATNFGVALSITKGVSEVMSRYGCAIVVEDDVVVSPAFLSFMNDALHRYRSDGRVWHVAGFTDDIDPEGLGDCFFWRAMYCWGWASWEDRWRHFERNPHDLLTRFDDAMIYRFNLDGAVNFWQQVQWNAAGGGTSWAIFWYASIFLKGGLCLNPSVSHVRNIGFDGSGNSAPNSPSLFAVGELNLRGKCEPPSAVTENLEAVRRIQQLHIRGQQTG